MWMSSFYPRGPTKFGPGRGYSKRSIPIILPDIDAKR